MMTKNHVINSIFLFSLLVTVTAYAAIPAPKSEGKYFQGKGTKTAPEYEQTAGMPVYEYGNGVQWGPVHLRPLLDYKYRWDDNVFHEEDSEKSDYVHAIYGDLKAELPLAGGQHLATAGAGFLREVFDRFDGQNHTDYIVHGGLKLNYVPFTLDLEDVFEETETRSDTEFTDRVNREENSFHSLLEVPFASFFLENEITNFTIDFGQAENRGFDHNNFTLYQRVGYDWRPNTQILAEYAYINLNYTEVGDRDGDGHQYMLGARGKFTEFLAYQAWIGAQHRIYDEDIRPDFNDFVFRAALQYEPTELNTWILRADRAPQESTFDGQSFYTRNRVALNWKRRIHERIMWNSQGFVSYNDYSRITVRPSTGEEETRRDWVWEAGTGLEYLMPNDIVALTLDYRFSSRASNLDGLDYDANEISVGIRAYF